MDVPPLSLMYTTRFPVAPCQTHAPLSALQAIDAYLFRNVNCVPDQIPSVELNVPADNSSSSPLLALAQQAATPAVVHSITHCEMPRWNPASQEHRETAVEPEFEVPPVPQLTQLASPR